MAEKPVSGDNQPMKLELAEDDRPPAELSLEEGQLIVHHQMQPAALVSISSAAFGIDGPDALNARSFEIRQLLR
jgi:hypothetical protein